MPILTVAEDSGNIISCEEMCTRYYPSVRVRVRFLLKQSTLYYIQEGVVEDLVQETFYRAIRAHSRLTSNQINAWLWRIATNVTIDYLRSHKSKHYDEHAPLEALFYVPDDESDPAEVYSRAECAGPAFSAWDALPPKYQAILWPLICGHKSSELAPLLGCSKSEMYKVLRRAREAYQRRYRAACQECA